MTRPINLNFGPEDWVRVDEAWQRWWAHDLPRPLVMIESRNWAHRFKRLSTEFLLEKPVDEVLDVHQTDLESRNYFGDAWPKWWPNFGPGIGAGFLGAKVLPMPIEETVWFEPETLQPIDELGLTFDETNPWWRRILDLTHAAVTRWGDRVSVAHTDIGGNLDILASFRTAEGLLYELVDSPSEVERLVRDITRHWIDFYDRLYQVIAPAGRGTTPWAAIRSGQRCYMLQSDFCYMISPKMFERFVLPDLAACCETLDHGFYHLDGKGQIVHLDMLLSLERLQGIQWIPGDGAPPHHEWLPLLKRIRDGGKLCQLYTTPAEALHISRELGGRGFAFYVQQDMNAVEAQDFLTEIGALS